MERAVKLKAAHDQSDASYEKKTLFIQIFKSSQVIDIITINSQATFDTH